MPAFSFPKSSIWWPYWRSAAYNPDSLKATARSMQRMNFKGVCLMGVEWGNDWALPTEQKVLLNALNIFRDHGIRPYLAAWVSQLDSVELEIVQRAWSIGNDHWYGLVLDAESQWVKYHQSEPEKSTRALKRFFNSIRHFMNGAPIGYAPYGVPGFHKGYDYNLWNNHADFVMPQIYFSSNDQDGKKVFSRAMNSWANIEKTFDRPRRPMIPIVNGYSENVNVPERKEFIKLSLAKHGHFSLWRHPVQSKDMRQMLRGLNF